MTIKEIKDRWYGSESINTEAELLRQTVEFINGRAECVNDGLSYNQLINEYLRDWNSNQ